GIRAGFSFWRKTSPPARHWTIAPTRRNQRSGLVRCINPAARRPPTHSDLKMSAGAVDDESSHDNEKHNRGGERPPVHFRPPWVGPPAVVAATRTTSIFKVWVYHLRARASYEPVPSSEGIKKAPASFPRGFK